MVISIVILGSHIIHISNWGLHSTSYNYGTI